MDVDYFRMSGKTLNTITLFLIVLFTKPVFPIKSRLTNWVKTKDNVALACQGDDVNIFCNDYEGIRVKEAFWGRDNKEDCQVDDPLSTMTDKEMCYHLDRSYAYNKVAEICQGHQSCQVIGSSLNFDTAMCPHIKKFARINYECRQLSGMRRSELIKHKKGMKKSKILHGRGKKSRQLSGMRRSELIKHKKGMKKSKILHGRAKKKRQHLRHNGHYRVLHKHTF